MTGCDGWSTFKILELGLGIACVIYKRISDDQASRLFFYLTKISREWPLLNNITWDQNGAIFTDVTYGGFIFISAGLLLGHCTGELNYCKKMETFFLIFGALCYIIVGSVLLAAIEWVPDDLIDNAAILGTITLVTAFIYICDLLSASTRRKKAARVAPRISRPGIDKSNQTDEKNTPVKEIYANGDANGNFQNGFAKVGSKKIPPNSVKILPTEEFQIPVTNSNNQYVGTIQTTFAPVFTPTELQKPEVKIKSTESFLKGEKGQYQRARRSVLDDNRMTPPGYSKIEPKNKVQEVVIPAGYVMIPIEDLNENQKKKIEDKSDDKPRKLQSPTITTTMSNPRGYYIGNGTRNMTPTEPKVASPQAPRIHHSSGSDDESVPTVSFRVKEKEQKKDRLRYPQTYSDESSPPAVPSMFELEYPSRKYTKEPRQYGKLNRGYSEEDLETRVTTPFSRNSLLRSSNYADRPRSKSKEEKRKGVSYPDDTFSSLDSRKLADDLKHLKDVTNTGVNVAQLEKENQKLKESLKKEQDEKYQLKTDLKLKNVEQKLAELDDRKNLERRIAELEQLRHELKLARGFRDIEEEKRIESKIKEMEDEKDRRMSEREEVYFGLLDLKKSQKELSPEIQPRMTDLEEYFRAESVKKGVQETNKKLKEKTKEQEDIKKVLDDEFHFLEDERLKQKSSTPKKKVDEQISAPDLTAIYQKQTERHLNKPKEVQILDRGHVDRSRGTKSPAPPYKQHESDEESSKPESTSYKSEAQFWLSSEAEDVPDGEYPRSTTPSSPRDPGFVLHAAKTWEGKSSPTDRLTFSSQKAQHLRLEKDGTKAVLKFDDETKIPQRIIEFIEFEDSQKAQLLDYDENQEKDKIHGRRSGMLVRKVDFPDNVTVREIRAVPAVGSTSTWKKWLQPKTKMQPTKSSPA